MATIIKRTEGKYLVRVFLGRDARGKQLFKNKTVRGTLKDAQRWARAQETAQDVGELVATTAPRTLSDQIQAWLDLKEPDVSTRTLEGYAYVKNYLGELAPRKIHQVQADDLTELYASLRSAGYSTRTIRRTHMVIRAALKMAFHRGQIKRDVTAAVRAPVHKRQTKIKAFNRDEARKFLRAANGSKYSTLFFLALETGLRPEEYLALRWSDVDLERRQLIVRQVLTHTLKGKREIVDKLKTQKARRLLPLTVDICARLKAHRATAARLTAQGGLDLVFPNDVGSPLWMNNLREEFEKVLKVAKLERRRLYDLRHSCATLLLDAGVNPKVISERLGHSDVAFTMQTYVQVLPHQQDEATAAFAQLVQL